LQSTGDSVLARKTFGYVFIFNSSTFVFDLTSNTNLGLGAELTNNTRFFEGKLDQLIIQRKLIGREEVAWRYNNGLGRPPRDLASLLLYFDFNETQGSVLPDQGPFHLEGTLKGYAASELAAGGFAWVSRTGAI
jgi:hypothetical protein